MLVGLEVVPWFHSADFQEGLSQFVKPIVDLVDLFILPLFRFLDLLHYFGLGFLAMLFDGVLDCLGEADERVGVLLTEHLLFPLEDEYLEGNHPAKS